MVGGQVGEVLGDGAELLFAGAFEGVHVGAVAGKRGGVGLEQSAGVEAHAFLGLGDGLPYLGGRVFEPSGAVAPVAGLVGTWGGGFEGGGHIAE